jgi:hypothetical protein
MLPYLTELPPTEDDLILVLRGEVTSLVALLIGPPNLTPEMRRLARSELTSCLLRLENLLKL